MPAKPRFFTSDRIGMARIGTTTRRSYRNTQLRPMPSVNSTSRWSRPGRSAHRMTLNGSWSMRHDGRYVNPTATSAPIVGSDQYNRWPQRRELGPSCGARNCSTMIVMMMAKTPSLNASSRGFHSDLVEGRRSLRLVQLICGGLTFMIGFPFARKGTSQLRRRRTPHERRGALESVLRSFAFEHLVDLTSLSNVDMAYRAEARSPQNVAACAF